LVPDGVSARGGGIRPPVGVSRTAFAVAAEQDVPALDLPEIDHFLQDRGGDADHRLDRRWR
jgi:hypothetical protein